MRQCAATASGIAAIGDGSSDCSTETRVGQPDAFAGPISMAIFEPWHGASSFTASRRRWASLSTIVAAQPAPPSMLGKPGDAAAARVVIGFHRDAQAPPRRGKRQFDMETFRATPASVLSLLGASSQTQRTATVKTLDSRYGTSK